MKQGKIAVIGLVGQSAFLSTNHFANPGETIQSDSLFYEIGGKGYNQAVACARMGMDTVFIGAIGKDDNGNLCRKALESEGIPGVFLEKDIPTAFAVITTDQAGENTVNVFPGAARALTNDDLFQPRIMQILQGCDYLLVQNELQESCLQAVVSLAMEMNLRLVFNPAPATPAIRKFLPECDVITPNYDEARLLLGIENTRAVTDLELAEGFCRLGVPYVVVTDGSRGAVLLHNGNAKRFSVYHHGETVDTTGAGDVFSGVLTAALASGKMLEQAIENAVVAAGISVTHYGAVACIPRIEEIETVMKSM